jgi:hypothetical protein
MDERAHGLLPQVLRDYEVPAGQVVQAKTGRQTAQGEAVNRDYLKKHFPDASTEMIDAFLVANRARRPVVQVYGPVDGAKLLSDDALGRFFAKGSGGATDGWKLFREAHPESAGIMELSCPAFSADGSEALICVGQQFHWLAGEGTYWLYRKDGSTWKKARAAGAWIS